MLVVFRLVCPAQTEGWEEPSIYGKLSSLQGPPCRKDAEKVRSRTVSGTSRQLFPGVPALYDAQIRSANSFASKSCLFGRTTDTCVQMQHCAPSVTQRRERCSPTGFLEGTAIVQSASGLRSLTDGCSETWTLYRWWIHSLRDQWWAGWQPNMVADSKSLYYPHTPCYHDIFLFGEGKGI